MIELQRLAHPLRLYHDIVEIHEWINSIAMTHEPHNGNPQNMVSGLSIAMSLSALHSLFLIVIMAHGYESALGIKRIRRSYWIPSQGASDQITSGSLMSTWKNTNIN